MSEGIDEMDVGEVWTVTKETEEITREMEAERAKTKEMIKSLRKCPVCGSVARIVVFGLEEEGVWVGCDETSECSRYIEYHKEGWSTEEAVAEWNRFNSGVFLVLRKIKLWFRRHISLEKWRKVRENKRKAKEKAKETAKRQEIFGIEKPKTTHWWQKVLKKASKKK